MTRLLEVHLVLVLWAGSMCVSFLVGVMIAQSASDLTTLILGAFVIATGIALLWGWLFRQLLLALYERIADEGHIATVAVSFLCTMCLPAYTGTIKQAHANRVLAESVAVQDAGLAHFHKIDTNSDGRITQAE